MANSSKLADLGLDQLFEAILTLETIDECYSFFEDLATVGELESLAQRLTVARMLLAKEKYAHIALATGASTATISRVKRCLNYGADGYKLVFNKLGSIGSK